MDSDEKAALPRINDLDTVPPPAGGDAYGNATVVRAAPSDILEAIRRERATEAGSKAPSEAAQVAAPPVDARREAPTDEISDIPVESTDVGPFAGAELEVDEAPIGPPPPLSAAALRPARVPADFEKLMSQRTDASLVGMSAQKPEEAEPLAAPTKKRSQAIVTVVVVVLVVWLAVLAAVTVAHFAGR
jgi:hypothetical protein